MIPEISAFYCSLCLLRLSSIESFSLLPGLQNSELLYNLRKALTNSLDGFLLKFVAISL